MESFEESNTVEHVQLLKGWRSNDGALSLAEVHSSVKCPDPSGSAFSKAIAFAGLGGMIAVGYMDPGNWYGILFPSQLCTLLVARSKPQSMLTLTTPRAMVCFVCNDNKSSACRATDLQAGSTYGYKLLIVVLLSNLVAMYLQYLALKLGVVAERDLAQACRDAYPKAGSHLILSLSASQCMLPCCLFESCAAHDQSFLWIGKIFAAFRRPSSQKDNRSLQWLVYFLWLVLEIAIAATDLAEIIGAATALNLLFNIPLWAGVLITALDVLLIIGFGIKNFRVLEVILPPPENMVLCSSELLFT